MNDTSSPVLEKKEKSWLVKLLKITFILAAFLLVGITVLANMSGSNDSLKNSVERFVSSVFQNRPTKVDKLVHMSFFPNLGFKAQGINVLSDLEGGHKIVTIGEFTLFMRFWNVTFRRPQIAQFYLEDFKAIKGAMGPKEFYVEKIFIDHDLENAKARLRGNGKIGNNPWAFNLSVDVVGSKGKYDYAFRRESDFSFDVADIKSTGTFLNHEDGYFKFKNLDISFDNNNLRGDLVLSNIGDRMLKLKGDINSSTSQNTFSSDLVFDYTRSPVGISGDIFSNGDVHINSITILFAKLREIIGYDESLDVSDESVEGYNWNALFDFSEVKFSPVKAQ